MRMMKIPIVPAIQTSFFFFIALTFFPARVLRLGCHLLYLFLFMRYPIKESIPENL
jgi:hypothetical protein